VVLVDHAEALLVAAPEDDQLNEEPVDDWDCGKDGRIGCIGCVFHAAELADGAEGCSAAKEFND
jgi:hypothetical protein